MVLFIFNKQGEDQIPLLWAPRILRYFAPLLSLKQLKVTKIQQIYKRVVCGWRECALKHLVELKVCLRLPCFPTDVFQVCRFEVWPPKSDRCTHIQHRHRQVKVTCLHLYRVLQVTKSDCVFNNVWKSSLKRWALVELVWGLNFSWAAKLFDAVHLIQKLADLV